MGGFIGGIVSSDKRLSPDHFDKLVLTIERRGTGTAFQQVIDPPAAEPTSSSTYAVYLAAAQEQGFMATGCLPGESPAQGNITLLDGFPADRSISELEQLPGNQRTVITNQGNAFLDQLCQDPGPFAFANLNLRADKLTLGRDILGRKTIYYFSSGDALWFSTDLPALLAVPEIPRRANPNAVYEFLRHGSWNNIDQSMFMDIHQLPPGAIMEIELAHPNARTVRQKRELPIPEIVPMSFDDAVDSTRSAFLQSVEQCILPGSGPLGASLSGGTDSSSIVTAMRHITGPDRDIHSFSFVTPGHAAINEERWIDIASNAAKTISHKIEIESSEFVHDVSIVTKELGEPLPGISNYLQYRNGKAARELGISSILDGISGDPVTGGYDYQAFDRLRGSLAQRDFRTSVELGKTILLHLKNRPGRAYIVRLLAQLPLPIHKLLRALARQEDMPSWLNQEWFGANDVHGRLPQATRGEKAFQTQILSMVIGSTLIRSAERNAVINGISSRMPFTEASFITHMLQLPESYVYGNDGQTRRVFLEAVRPFVPTEILNRTDKVGFSAPDNHWLAEQRTWVDSILASAQERGLPFTFTSIPENIADQQTRRSDIVRCIALAVWADCFDVEF